MDHTIEQARERYRKAVTGGDPAEFLAVKSALIEALTGVTLNEDQLAFI